MCWVASMRWAEDEFRIGIRIQLPTALLLTAGAFVLFKGDLGNWTLPITTLIQPIAVSTKFLIGYGQGNMLKWCGAGYPTLAFGVRKSILSYIIGIYRSENKEGKMSNEAMVKAIKVTSFAISVSVLLGNIMLLYLSQDLKYAAIASIFSIFTETAGKAYVVKSTQAQINKHLERGVMKGAKATAAAIADVLRQVSQQGANEEGASGEQDEKMTPEYWAENAAMLATRWSQEIIVEKSCIIYGAVATMLINAVKSPHSLVVQLQLLAIFYGCEIFADLLFVWCGAGYPTLAFGVRKSILSYGIGIYRSANKEGKMSTEAMVKCIKLSAFTISVAVLEGNIMLLYLSQDLKYAAIASIFSIFTETAGKAYVVRSTQALIDKHIKKGIQKGSTATAAAMVDALLMAGNEGGVNSAMGMAAEAGVVPELLARNEVLSKEKAMLEMVEEELSKIVVELGEANKRLGGDWDEANVEARLESARARTAESNDEEEGSVANEAVDEVQNEDEKMTPEFWAEILAMLAIRWSQEIIVEKSCIIYGAVVTMLINAVKSPHSIQVQLQLLAIFYGCELVADFMLVFVLDAMLPVFSFETSLFSTASAVAYTQEHSEIPVFAVSLYLVIVFYLPQHVPEGGYNLRSAWAVWNLLLSLFSLFGVVRTVPYLLAELAEKGFYHTACTDSTQWFLRHDEPNPVGFWVTLFIYSKIPELLDTVFLVLQKKEVIFLHWFHHVTVLLYCWHAFANWTASGLWFVAMNFSVHSVMYFYYFLAISGYKSLARPLAKSITTIQLLQMLIGTTVTCNVIYHTHRGDECSVVPSNYKLGLAM
ncbi:hypothetical protein TeGR_g1151, partial [Tetraparma gracilis]